MPVLRFIALLALAIWLGGMLVLGAIVAPSAFGVLQAQAGVNGRVLAGAVFGQILARFYVLSYICGAIILVCLIAMKAIGPSPRAFVLRAAIVSVMLALSLYAGIPVAHEINGLQAQVSGAISQLPDADPRRIRFDQLHKLSTQLMTGDIVLGLVLLALF